MKNRSLPRGSACDGARHQLKALKLPKLLKANHLGTSLMEMMIVMLVMSSMGAGMMSMITANTRSVASTAASTDFASLVTTLQGIFNQNQNCQVSLGGFNMNPAGAFPQNASPIKSGGATGTTVAQLGLLGTSLNITKLEFTGATALGAANQYLATLHLVAAKVVGGGGAVGQSSLTHDFQLILTIDPAQSNKIVGCSGQGSSFWTAQGGAGDIIYSGGNVAVGAVSGTIKDTLQVKGTISSSEMLKSFTVGGTSSTFCPVLIGSADLLGQRYGTADGVQVTPYQPWNRRQEFEIYRDETHESVPGGIYDHGFAGNGTFRLYVNGEPGNWGESRQRIFSYYYQEECWNGGTYCDPVADIEPSYFDNFIVVWLRGGATYQLRSLMPNTGNMLVDANPTCGTKTAPFETYAPRTTYATTFVKDKVTYPAGAMIGSSAAVGIPLQVQGPTPGILAYFSDTTSGRYVRINTEQGGGGASIGFANAGQYWDFGVNSSQVAFIAPAGSMALQLYTNGNGWLRGSLTQASDERLKQDILEIPNALAKVEQIPGVFFDWKDEKEREAQGHQIGVVAQTLQKQVPELVTEIENPNPQSSLKKILTVDYPRLSALIIQAVRELYALVKTFHLSDEVQINSLKAEVSEIKAQNDLLKKENAEIKARLDKLERK